MIAPTITAVIEAIKTAPAAISFMFRICSFLSVDVKSIAFSMAVLIISVTHTKAMQKTIQMASILVNLKRKARTMITMEDAKCIQALCSVRKKRQIPRPANVKLFALAFHENPSGLLLIDEYLKCKLHYLLPIYASLNR